MNSFSCWLLGSTSPYWDILFAFWNFGTRPHSAQLYVFDPGAYSQNRTFILQFHEIEILRALGQNRRIMSLFLPFRHRQYVGLLQPAFTTLRDRLDLLHRLLILVYWRIKNQFLSYKKSGGHTNVIFREPGMSKEMAATFSSARAAKHLKQPGLFGPNAVVYVLREVIAGKNSYNSEFYEWPFCSVGVPQFKGLCPHTNLLFECLRQRKQCDQTRLLPALQAHWINVRFLKTTDSF